MLWCADSLNLVRGLPLAVGESISCVLHLFSIQCSTFVYYKSGRFKLSTIHNSDRLIHCPWCLWTSAAIRILTAIDVITHQITAFNGVGLTPVPCNLQACKLLYWWTVADRAQRYKPKTDLPSRKWMSQKVSLHFYFLFFLKGSGRAVATEWQDFWPPEGWRALRGEQGCLWWGSDGLYSSDVPKLSSSVFWR